TDVSRAEHARQLVGRRHLELIVATVAGTFVWPPAQELRGVSKARPLHVIVRDLADTLGLERLPAQVLAAVPAARRAGHPLPGRGGVRLRVGPVAPRVAFERIVAQRCELGHELLA